MSTPPAPPLIVDSHTHAWRTWPYQPPVPDPAHRGRLEQLLFEMDQAGVAAAVVICASIGDNRDNAADVVADAASFPDRIFPFVDLDCRWSAQYRTDGAAERLHAAADRLPIAGFTYYMAEDDDGTWLSSPPGIAFLAAAAERRLIASVACRPQQAEALEGVAERNPTLPILWHHLGGLGTGDDPAALERVLLASRQPNIFVKVSGFGYLAQRSWDFPYPDTHNIVHRVYHAFGPDRLCWGSDYPVVRRYMTYRQALEVFRSRCDFIPVADREQILGHTMQRLLERRTASAP